MSIYLNTSSVPGVLEDSCHLMPFDVEHDGSANVSSYFTTSIREEREGDVANRDRRHLSVVHTMYRELQGSLVADKQQQIDVPRIHYLYRKLFNDSSPTASFRGRPLNGQHFTLPSGYSGIVVKENRKPVTEDEDRELSITHQFQKMTYWNLDKLPSADDRFTQAMQWADIAKALHRPVDEESSQKSVTGK